MIRAALPRYQARGGSARARGASKALTEAEIADPARRQRLLASRISEKETPFLEENDREREEHASRASQRTARESSASTRSTRRRRA
jgi:hypothetical protein